MTRETNLDRTYKGLSKLLLEFNLDFDVVCKTLREYYVIESYKSCKTITRTSLKIGIDRRTVSKIIQNKEQYQKPSSIFLILNRIKCLAEENNMYVNKKGNNSVASVILDVAHGSTTINSVINELVELGCLQDLGDKVKFITSHISKTPDKQRTLQIFSNHLDRYIETIVTNLHSKEKNFEYTVFSTKINPKDSEEFRLLSRNILTETTNQLRALLDKFDQDVPAGTFAETGVALTHFNLIKKEEQ